MLIQLLARPWLLSFFGSLISGSFSALGAGAGERAGSGVEGTGTGADGTEAGTEGAAAGAEGAAAGGGGGETGGVEGDEGAFETVLESEYPEASLWLWWKTSSESSCIFSWTKEVSRRG